MSDVIRMERTCTGCSGTEPPTTATPIGRSVSHETAFNRGIDRVKHTFTQCGTCGSIWVEVREGGSGGRGLSYERLTKHLF